VFVTNVVKHFRWRPDPRSKRRLHERPAKRHIQACGPWIEAELALVRPAAVVAMGAVAAEALLGDEVAVMRDRGRRLASRTWSRRGPTSRRRLRRPWPRSTPGGAPVRRSG
jgi:DNA polymerase